MTAGFEIAYRASPEARAAIGALRRTEDLRFSPSSRRLAIADFIGGAIAVLDTDITGHPDSPRVDLTGGMVLSSERLDYPHGLAFLDDDTIIVANRASDVAIVRLTAIEGATSLVSIDPPHCDGFQLICAPGSLDITRDAAGEVELLVCNNSDVPATRWGPAGIPTDLSGGSITRHQLRKSSGNPVVISNSVLLRRWLDVPDGIAISPCGRWLAVSNHGHRIVMLYDRSSAHERANPQAILRGALYPHGLRFSSDSRHLLVADAGAPYVHVFERRDPTWGGVQHPVRSVRVMDDEVFNRGPEHPAEGGPKGIDIDGHGHVLALTSECSPLSFFTMRSMLDPGPGHCPDRELQVRYELDLIDSGLRASARASRMLASLRESTSFRVTEPLRSVRRAWLRSPLSRRRDR